MKGLNEWWCCWGRTIGDSDSGWWGSIGETESAGGITDYLRFGSGSPRSHSFPAAARSESDEHLCIMHDTANARFSLPRVPELGYVPMIWQLRS